MTAIIVLALGAAECGGQSEEIAVFEAPNAAALPCDSVFKVVADGPNPAVIRVGETAEFVVAVQAHCDYIETELPYATPPFRVDASPVAIDRGLQYRFPWSLDGTAPGVYHGELSIPVRSQGVVETVVVKAVVEVED
ncbi:MAG: hypothetical protein AB8H79_06020 [Myxococcota bacterium]